MNTHEPGPFHRAAVRLRFRFYRRFPTAPATRWDLTSIKDRWYRRGTAHIARERFGLHKETAR